MGMYLDLDDAVVGHPKAQAELAALRAENERLKIRVSELEEKLENTNPACVNPSHLFWGTMSDNIKDSVQKGRHRSIGYKKHTHCKNGHPLDGENAYTRPNGWRGCRICKERSMELLRLNNKDLSGIENGYELAHMCGEITKKYRSGDIKGAVIKLRAALKGEA